MSAWKLVEAVAEEAPVAAQPRNESDGHNNSELNLNCSCEVSDVLQMVEEAVVVEASVEVEVDVVEAITLSCPSKIEPTLPTWLFNKCKLFSYCVGSSYGVSVS